MLAALLLAFATAADSAGTLTLAPCVEPALAGGRCGTYTVWENRAAQGGRTIALRLVVLPASEPDVRVPDPLFVLAGGPGQGAAELAPALAERWSRVRRRRDLVFVDQRGTGASNPLRCEPPVGLDTLSWLLRSQFDVEMIRQCRPGLERRADLVQYTTPIAMDDLDEIRGALGYDRVNLVGGSYGSRAALVYARQHPARVRTLLLESVASVDMRIPLTFARDAQLAFAGLARDCRADSACARAFPDPERDLERVLARFDSGPARVSLTSARTGGTVEVTVERGWVAEAIRYLLYNPENAALLPGYLRSAADGDLVPLVAFGLQQRFALWQQLSLGVMLTVTCAEDLPFITDAEARRWSAGTYLGDHRIVQQRRACAAWPRAALPRDYGRPVKSDAPALLVAGEFDPATSALIAHAVARHLPRGRVVVVPHAGHSTYGLVNASCVDRIEEEFLDSGSADELDDWCLRDVRRPAFAR